MTLQNDVLNYYIELPASADPEVIEWFQFMNLHGDLSLELVKLVQNYISINHNEKSEDFAVHHIDTAPFANQTNFFDSLYNCNDASRAIFCEEKRVKKKMLSV
jgi:hypothetical protein